MSDLPYGYVMPPASTPAPAQIPVPKRPFFFTPSVATDFDAIPHEKLREIIDSTDAGKVSEVGKRLRAAADKIKDVGDDLKRYMDEDHVPWRGDGGKAFRAWGEKMVTATLNLAHYSETAGTWMSNAATDMADVKTGMPHVQGAAKKVLAAYAKANPPGQLTLDDKNGPTLKEVGAARAQLDSDHADAARLMRKLAGSYIASTMNIQAATEPVFPPLPSAVMPPRRDTQWDDLRHISIAGGTGGGGNAPRNGSIASTASDSRPAQDHSSPAPRGAHRPIEHVGTEIAGLPTATHDAVVPRGGETVSPSGGVRVGPGPVAPQPGPFVPPVSPVSPRVPGTSGGNRPPNADRTSQASRSRGFSEPPSTRSPRNPADGVVGGRPSPAPKDSPVSRIPRGTVIGNEPVQGGGTAQGRPAMGRPFGPGGASGSVGGPSGSAAGRRLAPGAEGIVGGSSQRRPGGTTGGTFTPGGSGLVRGNPAGVEGAAPGRGSAVAPPGSQAGKKNARRGRGGERPDYLVEDEETWTSGHGRVAPPVIE
ncbi:hypothetical protein AB0I49_12780 [Streptomyces sp. NPDC050617]|uniref:WXG100 family type VII secretion target n=1 Tax=Streptomyces sp. NPDC050617 TaxID=3154628 RepID=UPI003427A9AE